MDGGWTRWTTNRDGDGGGDWNSGGLRIGLHGIWIVCNFIIVCHSTVLRFVLGFKEDYCHALMDRDSNAPILVRVWHAKMDKRCETIGELCEEPHHRV
jgi:hypothetical protein